MKRPESKWTRVNTLIVVGAIVGVTVVLAVLAAIVLSSGSLVDLDYSVMADPHVLTRF